ncbi:17329_t:CDS:1, partial [Entrophospora sp. SA101]
MSKHNFQHFQFSNYAPEDIENSNNSKKPKLDYSFFDSYVQRNEINQNPSNAPSLNNYFINDSNNINYQNSNIFPPWTPSSNLQNLLNEFATKILFESFIK